MKISVSLGCSFMNYCFSSDFLFVFPDYLEKYCEFSVFQLISPLPRSNYLLYTALRVEDRSIFTIKKRDDRYK